MKHLVKLCVYTFDRKPTAGTYHKIKKIYDLKKVFKLDQIHKDLKWYIHDYIDKYRALMIPINSLDVIEKYFPKYYRSKPIELRKMIKLASNKYKKFINKRSINKRGIK